MHKRLSSAALGGLLSMCSVSPLISAHAVYILLLNYCMSLPLREPGPIGEEPGDMASAGYHTQDTLLKTNETEMVSPSP